MPTPDISTAEIRALCAAHRRAGRPYSEIARLVGISKTAAHRHVQHILDEYRHQGANDISEHVRLQLMRLDHAMIAIMPKIESGDVASIETMIRLEARRARLLGLDAPAKVAPTTPDGLTPYTGSGGGLASLLAEAAQFRKPTE